MRACRFSSVMSGSRPAKRSASSVVVDLHRGRDRELEELDAEALGERPRVVLGAGGGVVRGHAHAGHALGPERVDRDQRHQRGVDPAREPDHDALEAVLLDVVARAERERGVDLGLVARAARRRRRRACPAARARRRSSVPGVADLGQHPVRRRAQARVAQPRGQRRAAGRRSRTSAPPRTAARARSRGPRGRRRRECPSKTSSSWPPTRLQNATAREVVARALGEHPLAREALAALVRRGARR